MRYTTELPAIYLTETELENLATVLVDETTDAASTYELHDGPTTYEFTTVEALLHDPTLPSFIREFTIAIECAEGEIELTADNAADDEKFELWMSGESPWVKRKRAEIEDYFDTKGDTVRTFLDGRIPVIAALLVGGLSYLALQLGIGQWYGITAMNDIYRLGFFALLLGAISQRYFNRLYPYVLLTTNSDQDLYPVLHRIGYVIGFIAALLTIHLALSG